MQTIPTLKKKLNFNSILVGEVIKTGDLKSVQGEGMPQYRNPFEKGRLIIQAWL